MSVSPTPRCIIVRHGQTEWSKSGHYTGSTDLPLTAFGESQMIRTGQVVFANKFVDPNHITYVFTSPRQRARRTVELVLRDLSAEQKAKVRVIVDEDLREWEYGDYEGLLTKEIVELRKSRGLDKERPWNIWRDGCENGESTYEFGLRLSRAIARIQELHRQHMSQGIPSDIMVFAHGHALRYFAGLWFKMGKTKSCEEPWEIEKPITCDHPELVPDIRLQEYRYLDENPNFLLDAGGMGVLSYAHHNIEEPSLALAGAFVCPPEEESQHGGV